MTHEERVQKAAEIARLDYEITKTIIKDKDYRPCTGDKFQAHRDRILELRIELFPDSVWAKKVKVESKPVSSIEMKTLKETIQEHFVVAMKAKDEIAKSALSGIKAKITEAEKSNNNQELTDSEVVKVLTKAIKQRRESQEIYEKAGREELARKEADEVRVLEMFLPAQMTESEIEVAVQEIIGSHPAAVLNNPNALVGKMMGEFNKKYTGRADASTVMSIIKKQIEK